MDLNEVPSDYMVSGMNIEEKNVANFDALVDKKLKSFRIKSIEQEQRCREVEEKRLALELEIRNKDMDLEVVKGKIRVLDDEKLKIEEEIKGLKTKKAALVGAELVDKFLLDEEVSRVDQLMVESKVLKCEKNVAAKDVEVWKRKCKELESRVIELEGRLKCRSKEDVPIGIKGGNSANADDVCASRDICSPSRLPGAVGGVMAMEGNFVAFTEHMSAVPYTGSSDTQCVSTHGTPTNKVHVKRRLAYQNVRSCDEKIAPLTPAEVMPSSASIIDIIDSDNEYDVPDRRRPNSQSEGLPVMMSKYGVQEINGITDEEKKSDDRENAFFITTPKTKRKRDHLVVTSDDECEDYECTPNRRAFRIENSDNEGEDDDDCVEPIRRVFNRVISESDDDDDNVPISQLKRNCAQASSQLAGPLNPTRPRRRLVKYGQGELRDKAHKMGNHSDTLTTENVADNGSSEDESESSVRSLSDFIVDDSDHEDLEDDISEEDGVDSYEVEDTSDSNLDFEEIISKLQSRRSPNSKWISEGDMLSDFGKNPELCMRAVCALYRQQTNEEKACKASIIPNGRGFSKFDATRGTILGEFLTDGDPDGDLVKSVEELQARHPNGLEECRKFADHYSKQLFKIYENGEDPFFP